MSSREEIINEIYAQYDEDARLEKNRHGQLEYLVTMNYIHRYLFPSAKILEVGAGTGRYSISLAKEGYDVTAVELVKKNLEILRAHSEGIPNIVSYQGDAVNLSMLPDQSYDVTLFFGPMYHLYEEGEVEAAINEAIRVTKKGGVILFAFLSIYAIMYSNYCYGNFGAGLKENFTKDYKNIRFKEQLFCGYEVDEFESLFENKPVEHLKTIGVDGMLEPLEKREDFAFSDEDFRLFASWYLTVAEKRENLGSSNHLLYICRKK